MTSSLCGSQLQTLLLLLKMQIVIIVIIMIIIIIILTPLDILMRNLVALGAFFTVYRYIV